MEITQKIINNAIAMPEKTAVISGNIPYSYEGLRRGIERMAREIADLGMEPGMPLAICMPNCIEFIFCLCGAELNGHCALLLSSKFKDFELSYHFKAAGIRYAFTVAGSEIDLTVQGFAMVKKSDSIVIWRKEEIPAAVPYHSGDYICQITSGTNGHAKGVRVRFILAAAPPPN